jgi:hypothetical protein
VDLLEQSDDDAVEAGDGVDRGRRGDRADRQHRLVLLGAVHTRLQQRGQRRNGDGERPRTAEYVATAQVHAGSNVVSG